MKKVIAICLILAILAGFLCFSAAAETPSGIFGCNSLKANTPLDGSEKLLPSADGVVLYELNSGTLVYAYEPDDRLNPSSMVKIMSALVAIENGRLDDLVTVRRETLDSIPIGSVSAGLQKGEELTLLDLLYCCLVSSANDATAVMAEHIAGSQAAFVDMMNEKARELGCVDTLFSNVNGLNDDIQYSTARDLAIITAAALENETFAQLFTTERYTLPATNLSDPREIYTTNYMASEDKVKGYFDSRVTGGKTAAATHTKRSLICTAQVGSAHYLSVVMSADSVMNEDNISVESFGSFLETALLLDHVEASYALRQILDDAQSYSQLGVQGGANDVVISPKRDVFTVLPLEYNPELLSFYASIDPATLVAPLRKGDPLGVVRISYGGVTLGECELAAMFDVPLANTTIRPAAPIAPEEQEQPVSHVFKWVLIGIGILIGVVLLVLLTIRLVRNARIRKLHQRRKRNRRRSR